jgi:hypothetical protein
MLKYLFVILLTFVVIASANAQYNEDEDNIESQIFVPPGSTFEPKAEKLIRSLKKNSLPPSRKIEVNEVTVSLVHYHYMEPDQFGLLLKVPNVTNGCFEVSPLEYEVNFVADTYMDVKIKSFRRELKKTQNVAFDCNQRNQAVSGLIVLNANDLKERGVKEIRFNNGEISDVYNISYKEDSIVLKPESMIAFKARGMSGPDKNRLVYFYSNKNLIALHVPMALETDNVRQQVNQLAYRNSLMPVFDQEGLDTTGTNHVYYFMDPRGRTISMLNEDGYLEMGAIRIPRPLIGAGGKSIIPISLKVFATRPETTL